ncbi:hypothetical protein [Natronorubrum daqingense]|uniref:Uncharacterized protein n=1 Tax=Natronorubrum daqingense TaxID=588898 RepID=A0A1N6ZWY9_9EURY|nr:hypothetical protein [Natronorubrum daqingense]APX95219.1 hypothetical protein BB347_00590 [Natronorubrum daqingense]SIR31283.1 hypothetical protein SAMN05421809_0946 [Natronorubrum daqingense]
MVLDLLVDVVSNVHDRPEHRTRFEQACVFLGLTGVLAGIVVFLVSQRWYGPLLALVAAVLLVYGR